MSIPRDPSWCTHCAIERQEGRVACKDHLGRDGKPKPYQGYDAYKPSEWVRSVVGKRYRGPDGFRYSCFGYDPRSGFWMRSDEGREANISEAAIDRTFHRTVDPKVVKAALGAEEIPPGEIPDFVPPKHRKSRGASVKVKRDDVGGSPALMAKVLMLEATADFWRCPNSGRVIDAAKWDDKALCGCGRPNPRAVTEAPGTHIKSFLQPATALEFLEQEAEDEKKRERGVRR